MLRRMLPPRRATQRPNEKLQQTYSREAARLREYAANTTTARIRARLLEAAAEQERLAAKMNAGRTGFVTVRPDTQPQAE
jgi:hypothetical protein